MRCFQCKGPYHPATGHYYREFKVAFCGGCYQPFVKWVAGHTKRKWSGASFYEEAATSIRQGVYPAPGKAFMVFQAYRPQIVAEGRPKEIKFPERVSSARPRGQSPLSSR